MNKMNAVKVIAGIIIYMIISILTTMLFLYTERKEGKPAQKIYKEDNFYEYYTVGFFFPISLPCLVIGIIAERICKFIKIMSIAIVETKIATEEKEGDNE